MRHLRRAPFICVGVVWVAAVVTHRSELGAQTMVPDIPYDVMLVQPPLDMQFGMVPGVAVNSRGHIFVFTRTGQPGPVYGGRASQLLEFGSDGTFIREIGKNFYGMGWAHNVRIDRDDNIWIVDNGTDMITKFSPEGRVIMVLGRRNGSQYIQGRPSGAPDRNEDVTAFREPTDVGWDSAGNIYITDGYVNSRVVKLDRNGRFLKKWGTKGTAPGQFITPHQVVVDASDRVYVSDRGNQRIQVFDTDGTFLKQITVAEVRASLPDSSEATQLFGCAMCITPGPEQVLYVSDYVPGKIYKLSLELRLLGVVGTTGRGVGQIDGVHGLACPSENVLFAAETRGWRAQKLTLRPDRTAGTSSAP